MSVRQVRQCVGEDDHDDRDGLAMASAGLKRAVAQAFVQADVCLDGRRASDIQVLDDRFYAAVSALGSLGLGESFMAGDWRCGDLTALFEAIYRADLHQSHVKVVNRLHFLRARLFNRQQVSRAFKVGRRHYDIGNDLYQAMLGPQMVYSGCPFASDAEDLASAEDAKLELICRKLDVQKGQRILDIGCGWGCFGKFAAERYGAHVVGVTVSKEQARLGAERCAGLPVEFRLEDYRSIEGEFDHVVSIGMMGHVGHKNYRTWMEVAHRALADDGLFLIHTMGANRSTTAADPWIDRYIFANGMAPSVVQVSAAFEHLFVLEDWHNFSTDYSRTIGCWLDNFERAWPQLEGGRYDQRFYRMWRYYLSCFGGAFAARTLQTWDVVLSKVGGRPKYRSLR